MKKAILILSLCLCWLSQACSSEDNTDFTKGYESTLTVDECKFINKAMSMFDERLKKQYGNMKNGLQYKKYLSDYVANNRQIPTAFTSPENQQAFAEMRESSAFSKIWILASKLPKAKYSEQDNLLVEEEIPIDIVIEDIEPLKVLDCYVLNPDGAYIRIAVNKTANSDINPFIKDLQVAPDLVSGVIASTMLQVLSDSDYNDSDTKLFIALLLYYSAGIIPE